MQQPAVRRVIQGKFYRAPQDLRVTPAPIGRVLVIGSCLTVGMADVINGLGDGTQADFIQFNNVAALPPPPAPIDAYGCQIVQIPMRSVLPDGALRHLAPDDEDGFAQAFAAARQRLLLMLDAILVHNTSHGLLSLVCGFLVPQANPLGRLLPRYRLANPVHFIERLNQALDQELGGRAGCHPLDLDAIAASLGKRFIQDDAVWALNHASALGDVDVPLDQARLEPVNPPSVLYQLRIYDFAVAIWTEAVAICRTIRRTDAVKLVIIDLDDTLWRGIHAEDGVQSLEGWPLGFAEALLVLKRRGVLLAIASRNDPAVIERAFATVLAKPLLGLDDFAVRRIGWQPKAESIGEIIGQVNVLASSVVFIDDNPVERAAAQAAHPGLRVLGAELYDIRRVLLWSAETQVPVITAESAQRTGMVAGQVRREADRTLLSRAAFLGGLGLRLRSFRIGVPAHPQFSRALELLNKTNQFNTTGRRWTQAELSGALQANLRLFAYAVEDRHTAYGLAVVVLVQGETIIQLVMSCRVAGLEVEDAVIADVLARLARGGVAAPLARLVVTGANAACQDLFSRTGFARRDGGTGDDGWVATGRHDVPAHIQFERPAAEAAGR